MLRTRVITALALMPVVLGMLFLANPPVWAVFVLVIALLACWEWSRMCGLTPLGQSLYLAASGAIGAFLWLLYLHILKGNFAAAALTGFLLASTFWIFAVPYWLATKLRRAGLYDAQKFEPLLPLPVGMIPLAVSSDGRRLAVSVDARRLQVWDLAEVRMQLRELGLDWMDAGR